MKFYLKYVNAVVSQFAGTGRSSIRKSFVGLCRGSEAAELLLDLSALIAFNSKQSISFEALLFVTDSAPALF